LFGRYKKRQNGTKQTHFGRNEFSKEIYRKKFSSDCILAGVNEALYLLSESTDIGDHANCPSVQ
jgi:hypothetical protein